MKYVTRKLIIFLFILLFASVDGYCLIGEIFDGIKWVAGQANEITDEVFKKNMLVTTTENLATLKRNYDDSRRFFDDFRRIQTNPYGVAKEVRDEFVNSLEDPVDRLYYEVDMRSYDKKGVFEHTTESGLEYVKKNWEFASKVKEKIKDRDKKAEKIADKLSSGDKATVEEGEKQMDLLKYEQFGAIERNLLKLIEIENKQLEKQVWYEELARQMQGQYASFAEQLQKAYKKQSVTSRKKKIEKILEEIPRQQLPE